ncbi:hypothetical protein WUBG_13052, partial [Wuchereria bancrofti]
EINSWASRNTNNRIMDFMGTAKINSQTKMLLLNTIYFKGVWKKPFSTDSQKKLNGLPMMQLNAVLKYYEDKLVQVVKVPYVGDEVEMVIILPKARCGLYKVREEMTGRNLRRYIENAMPTKVELKLPKFELKQELNLADILEKLGITGIISEKANFRALSDSPISVGKIIHGASFKVNGKAMETRTEIGFTSPGLVFRKNIIFNADQPFLFFVISKSEDVLFAGQCCKKTKNHMKFEKKSKYLLKKVLF